MRYARIQQIQLPVAMRGMSVGTYAGHVSVSDLGGYTVVKIDVLGLAPAILHLTPEERNALVRALEPDKEGI